MNIFKLFGFIFILYVNLNATDKVSLQLEWLHQFQFAGYYMAKEKGFYKEKDLDVEIKEYKNGTHLTQDVLNSKSDFAVGKSSLIIDGLEGKDIVLLSAIYQSSPMVLIALDNPNTQGIKDLKGKQVSLTSDAKLMAGINSMLVSNGLNSKDMKYIKHSFNIEDLINGKTDAMACYLSNEPYILDQKNIKYKIYDPKDYGFDFYGGILFTSKKELENHPLRVKHFREASLKGWRYAFENIEETAKLIFEKYNTQNKTLDSLIYEGEVLKKLSGYNEGLLGKIDKKKVKELKRLYSLLFLDMNIRHNIDDLIYHPNSLNLTKEEKEYLKNNTINLLTNNDFPPMAFVDKNGELTGLEIEYWNLINQKLNNVNSKVRYIKRSKEGIKIINEEDKNALKYSFSILDGSGIINKSNTIFTVPLVLITRKGIPFISNISDLSNKKVAIYKNSSFYKVIKKKYPNLEFVPVDNTEDMVKKLLNNEVFGIIEKLPRISYLIHEESYPNMKISGTFDFKYNARLSIKKTNKILQSIINKAILAITTEDRKKINSKYYYVVYQTSHDYSWIYKIVLPLLLLLTIIVIINRKLKKEIKKREETEEKLHEIASLDPLTNSYNRRKIEKIFENEIIRVKRYKRDLSIVFIDIDNFKKINDTLGHKVGDEVLVQVVKCIKENIRGTDYMGRWGGEEFIILLPETTKKQAKEFAYLIKDRISKHDFNIGRKITASFGVTQFEPSDTFGTFVDRADNAMYNVKKNGKDDVNIV